jgi:hypothetical protein
MSPGTISRAGRDSMFPLRFTLALGAANSFIMAFSARVSCADGSV